MSAFDLADGPRSIQGGARSYDIRQLFPQTAAISGTRPGVSGATTGQTTFQFNQDSRWWVPSLSYFNIRGHFTDTSGNALSRTSGIAYVDNWPAALFSQIQGFCNSQSLELLQNPAQADQALTISSVDKTFLESFASLAGEGEALTTRQLNSAQFGTSSVSATNYNEVVAAWRPSLSLFDHCTGIPPGAQWRFDLSWAATGEQNVIESTSVKIAGTDYFFFVDELTMYVATIEPDPSIPLPMSGFIELNPVQVNTYPLTGGNTLQVNVPLPATCHRALIVFQDNNTANSLAAGQNGINPITCFRPYFSSGATVNASWVQNLYMSFPELGTQAPNPQYSLTAGVLAGAKSDWQRAYGDFVTITRGASGGYEGSVPFGTADIGIGAAVLAPLASTPVMTVGDPNNRNQAWVASTSTGAVSATQANQTANAGWFGRNCIFAFPCVRPVDKLVTNANVALTLSASATSVLMYVILSFSMGIAVELGANGKYNFEIVLGL